MGKVRKEKRHKLILKTPGAAPGARNTSVMASQSVEEVLPLPEEVLKSVPIMSLKGTKVEVDQDSEPVLVMKKDKRRLKREHCYFCSWSPHLSHKKLYIHVI